MNKVDLRTWIPCYLNCLVPVHEVRWIHNYITKELKEAVPIKTKYVRIHR